MYATGLRSRELARSMLPPGQGPREGAASPPAPDDLTGGVPGAVCPARKEGFMGRKSTVAHCERARAKDRTSAAEIRRQSCAADGIVHIAALSNYCIRCQSNVADRATAQWHLVAAAKSRP
eukprot:9232838-Pyramimonas_sp.AAC.1